MKILLFAFIFFISCSGNRNKKTLHFSSMGYDRLNLFIYDIIIKDSSNEVVANDTLGFFYSDLKDMRNQTFSQCVYLTKKGNNNYSRVQRDQVSFGGSYVTDSFILLHPPRSGIYKELEFCSMPYFFSKSIGSTWKWRVEIGAFWAINGLYPMKEEETFIFHNEYKIQDTLTMQTALGALLCYHITAMGTSKFGTTQASYYMNSETGLVFFKLTSKNKRTFSFTLIEKSNKQEDLNINKEFVSNYQFYKRTARKFYDTNYFRRN